MVQGIDNGKDTRSQDITCILWCSQARGDIRGESDVGLGRRRRWQWKKTAFVFVYEKIYSNCRKLAHLRPKKYKTWNWRFCNENKAEIEVKDDEVIKKAQASELYRSENFN